MKDSTSPPPARLIGVDVGGTKIAGVLIEEPAASRGARPRVLARSQRSARPGADALVEDIGALVDELLASTPLPAAAIGIGTPGSVDGATGDVRDIANLGVDHVALGARIHARFGVPVVVENDVNAAALGAQRLLCDERERMDTVVFLNLGTGLAAGVLRAGRLDRGSSNTVGEIGHIPVEPHRWRCGCGQTGCLETAGSGGAATRLWPYDDPPMPAMLRAAADPAARRHDEAARKARTVVSAIADAVDVLATTVDPTVIIVGGGMAKTGEPLLEAIRAELRRRSAPSPFAGSLRLPERLRLAAHDVPYGAVGAALAACDALRDDAVPSARRAPSLP